MLPQHYETKLTTTYLPRLNESLVFEIKRMALEIKLGDVVRLKKKHPCGSYEWQVVRLGVDIGLKCLKCQHRILLERSVFERRVSPYPTPL